MASFVSHLPRLVNNASQVQDRYLSVWSGHLIARVPKREYAGKEYADTHLFPGQLRGGIAEIAEIADTHPLTHDEVSIMGRGPARQFPPAAKHATGSVGVPEFLGRFTAIAVHGSWVAMISSTSWRAAGTAASE